MHTSHLHPGAASGFKINSRGSYLRRKQRSEVKYRGFFGFFEPYFLQVSFCLYDECSAEAQVVRFNHGQTEHLLNAHAIAGRPSGAFYYSDICA